MKSNLVLGIDIGGSGIKGAIVNLKTGEMTTEKHRIPAPKSSTSQAVVDTIRQIAKKFGWEGPIGAGQKNKGVVIMLTVGTGIGCALFTQGKLLKA